MPTSDLDLPLLPSADQIRSREFATIRRGYDPDQVREYLHAVASQVESLERDLKEARTSLESSPVEAPSVPMPAAPEADPYDKISKRFAGLIATADREASRIVDEAKTEADRIRTDAQANAEAARQEGEDALGSARTEADRVLQGLASRRVELVDQLDGMRSRLLTVARDLATVVDGAEPPAGGLDALPATADADVDATAEPIAAPAPQAATSAADPMLDPRYEDLWVSSAEQADAEADVGFEELLAAPDDDDDDDDGDDVAAPGEGEGSIDLPDFASIELDFDQEGSESVD